MKDLLEVIAKALVDMPEEVQVTEITTDDTIRLELRVASDDVGKVIGKQGKIAKAIRTLVKSSAIRDSKKVYIDINQ